MMPQQVQTTRGASPRRVRFGERERVRHCAGEMLLRYSFQCDAVRAATPAAQRGCSRPDCRATMKRATALLKNGNVYIQSYSGTTTTGLWIADGPVYDAAIGAPAQIGRYVRDALAHSRRGIPVRRNQSGRRFRLRCSRLRVPGHGEPWLRDQKHVGLKCDDDSIVTITPSANYENEGGSDLHERALKLELRADDVGGEAYRGVQRIKLRPLTETWWPDSVKKPRRGGQVECRGTNRQAVDHRRYGTRCTSDGPPGFGCVSGGGRPHTPPLPGVFRSPRRCSAARMSSSNIPAAPGEECEQVHHWTPPQLRTWR
jgi:hypothetical protein